MTKEEAIELLIEMHHNCYKDTSTDPKRFMKGDAIDIALECIEKQIPKKPILKPFIHKSYLVINKESPFWSCPVCGKRVEVDDNEGYSTEYYPACQCGQLIDWDGIIETLEMKWIDDSVEAIDWSDNE